MSLAQVPLFPEIVPRTKSYTFSHPTGLVHATQFTQPAIVLVEKAIFDVMKVSALLFLSMSHIWTVLQHGGPNHLGNAV